MAASVTKILIVDDDRDALRFMEDLLRAPDREIQTLSDPHQAVARAKTGGFDLVVSDVHLGTDISGIDVLRAFKGSDPNVEVVLVSGSSTLDTALEAVRDGAFDYISKPFSVKEVRATVERALRRRAQSEEPAVPPSEPLEPTPADGLIGRSRGMLVVYKQIAQAAQSEVAVLVTGETGTGKELVARAIHRHSRRSDQPFVAVNCGALAESLLESELFGHVRGSFTGAVNDKKGLFEQAHGGVIFLDEIGETSAAVQVRLLRAIEEGEIRPVGASRVVKVNVRVIAATNRDLQKEVERAAFRQDLLYRLNVLPVQIPPLRERREDMPQLVSHFLRVVSERGGGLATITEGAMAVLAAQAWAGNVRELENMIERLALAARGGAIDADDLPTTFREPSAVSEGESLFSDLPSLEELEKRYLKHVLAAVNGNRSRAAEILGVDRRTLYRMADRFGLDLEPRKSNE
jgi:DNA-binding NtrC family response regulator